MPDQYTVVDGVNSTKKGPEADGYVDQVAPDEDVSSVDSYSETVDTSCGIGSCRPHVLQRCNNPPILCCCLCVYTLIHGKFIVHYLSYKPIYLPPPVSQGRVPYISLLFSALCSLSLLTRSQTRWTTCTRGFLLCFCVRVHTFGSSSSTLT